MRLTFQRLAMGPEAPFGAYMTLEGQRPVTASSSAKVQGRVAKWHLARRASLYHPTLPER